MGPVLAYIDPGTGALVWQSILAAGFGAAFYARRAAAGLRARLHLGPKAPRG